ncbi:Neutral/alkaline non-lysosomal ceramidase [Stieleria maiorica]|uniref:Neutral/alkaline non-lysosomal ceramidase n=1 Tax=Stieleria maiorica TaxID=2795974 RepID=A0A5B9MQ37_9BACT|nr:neutral/alkaline non-lysosomal ceramidase N-terminal domain-containing protein [Stieleria maiorica]QEG01826.1 Neutral/alkaline non-lysosomal ceramidase [Stieleria maiorica]
MTVSHAISFSGRRVRTGNPSGLLLAATIALLILNSAGASAQSDSPIFRAGAATSNITPPLGELIVGGWEPTPAQHIHDELHARCLVLDDGKTTLAIVLCDNVGIPHDVFDAAKAQVHQATGIPIENMLMASTHTHSATTARGESKVIQQSELTDYQKFLAGRIADGIRRALNHLEPAKIGWGGVDEPSEVFNRRWFVTDPQLAANPFGGVDQVRMNPPRGHAALDRPAGPVDPEVSFVSVQSRDGRPIALLANYSLHYVGGVPRNDVSADYFGYFARAIKQRLGANETTPAFVGMLSNGTSGDVNNIDFRNKTPKRYASYEKMQEVANKIADRVYDAHTGIQFHDWVKLSAASTPLTLKVRQPTQAMRDYFAELEKQPESSPRHRREAIYARRIANLDEAPETVDIQLQTLRIGDLGIAAIPFETFTETGLELKAKAPTGDMFTIELANGSFGYLPTPRQHRYGGYETWLGTNNVQEDASEKIVETLLKLFDSMK